MTPFLNHSPESKNRPLLPAVRKGRNDDFVKAFVELRELVVQNPEYREYFPRTRKHLRAYVANIVAAGIETGDICEVDADEFLVATAGVLTEECLDSHLDTLITRLGDIETTLGELPNQLAADEPSPLTATVLPQGDLVLFRVNSDALAVRRGANPGEPIHTRKIRPTTPGARTRGHYRPSRFATDPEAIPSDWLLGS